FLAEAAAKQMDARPGRRNLRRFTRSSLDYDAPTKSGRPRQICFGRSTEGRLLCAASAGSRIRSGRKCRSRMGWAESPIRVAGHRAWHLRRLQRKCLDQWKRNDEHEHFEVHKEWKVSLEDRTSRKIRRKKRYRKFQQAGGHGRVSQNE